MVSTISINLKTKKWHTEEEEPEELTAKDDHEEKEVKGGYDHIHQPEEVSDFSDHQYKKILKNV